MPFIIAVLINGLKKVDMAHVNSNLKKNLFLSMFDQRSYPYKTIAFAKVNFKDGAKMLAFVIDKNKPLRQFLDQLIKPIHRNPNHVITCENLLFVAFHEKTKGEKQLTMEKNPKYLTSWTKNRGFFNKADAKLADTPVKSLQAISAGAN